MTMTPHCYGALRYSDYGACEAPTCASVAWHPSSRSGRGTSIVRTSMGLLRPLCGRRHSRRHTKAAPLAAADTIADFI